jgi:hypothetical protein
MTLLRNPPEMAAPGQSSDPVEDSEALFKEARQRRRRRWTLGSGMIALLVLALCIGVLVMGTRGRSGLTGVAPGPDQPGKGPGSLLLPGSTGSFHTVATGVLADTLDCASETTCFAVVYPQPGDALHDWLKFRGEQVVAKTADGGVTWVRIGTFPRRRWSPQPVMSCPTVEMCALAVQPATKHNNFLPAQAIAITKDGGSSWTIHELSLPAALSGASVSRIACTDELHCLAYVGAQGSSRPPGTFLSTSDGGATWTETSTVPPVATEAVTAQRCDLDGRCIALVTWPGGATLTSSDFGEGTASSFPSSGVMHASCGDALHCLYSTSGGGLAFTQNGGKSWGLSHVSVPEGQTITAVDCDNGMDCFTAAAQWDRGNYTNPVIYRTEDGGQTWRSLKVPARADGWFVSTIIPLSCPTSGGCIGIAQTRPSSSQPMTKRVVISSFLLNPAARR